MLTLTLDTNVVRDLAETARTGHAAAVALVAKAKAVGCDVKCTTRLDFDVPDGQLRATIEGLGYLEKPIPAVGRYGFSKWDCDDWAGEEDSAVSRRLLDLLFPGADPAHSSHKNRLSDVDHLQAHERAGRGAFVTSDKAILGQARALERDFGIVVLTPDTALASLGPSEPIVSA